MFRNPSHFSSTTNEEWDALLAEVRKGNDDDKSSLPFTAKMSLRHIMQTILIVANDGSTNKAAPSPRREAEGRNLVKEEQRTIKMSPALSPEACKVTFRCLLPPAKHALWSS